MGLTRPLAVALGVLAGGIAAEAISAEAQHGTKEITCANTASGTTWQIKIDFDQKTVDSNPASISDSTISWRDMKDGWNYSLDRRNGHLTVVLASSTGGSMYFHQCKLDN
jgi:hypothetical protein